jgi:hypothetical protein
MGLKKNLENLFAAATFAEEGEFETARQLGRRRNVLLVLRGTESDRVSFKYALNMSKRVEAGLEVLYVSPEKEVRGILNSVEDEARKEGIDLKVSRKTGCLKQEVLDYTGKRRDIQLVVVESTDGLEDDCTEKELLRAWNKHLDCPLVIVSEALRG